MKYLFFSILLITGLSGCAKFNGGDLAPDSGIRITDTSAHHITFTTAPQHVIVSVSGTKLTMIYSENVDLYIKALGYDQTWAVHLYDDFTASLLHNFDFTTTDPAGDVILNWVDDNLNNTNLKTISDTTINGTAMIKINVHRLFTFSKEYTDEQSADNELQALIAKKGDKISFVSDVYFTEQYPASKTSLDVVYDKSNN